MGTFGPFQFLYNPNICYGFLLSVLYVVHLVSLFQRSYPLRSTIRHYDPMGHGLQLEGSTRPQLLMNMGAVGTSDLIALFRAVVRNSRILACITSNEASVQTPFDG